MARRASTAGALAAAPVAAQQRPHSSRRASSAASAALHASFANEADLTGTPAPSGNTGAADRVAAARGHNPTATTTKLGSDEENWGKQLAAKVAAARLKQATQFAARPPPVSSSGSSSAAAAGGKVPRAATAAAAAATAAAAPTERAGTADVPSLATTPALAGDHEAGDQKEEKKKKKVKKEKGGPGSSSGGGKKEKRDKKGKGKEVDDVPSEPLTAAPTAVPPPPTVPVASSSKSGSHVSPPAVPAAAAPTAPESVAGSTASNAEAKKARRKQRKEEKKQQQQQQHKAAAPPVDAGAAADDATATATATRGAQPVKGTVEAPSASAASPDGAGGASVAPPVASVPSPVPTRTQAKANEANETSAAPASQKPPTLSSSGPSSPRKRKSKSARRKEKQEAEARKEQEGATQKGGKGKAEAAEQPVGNEPSSPNKGPNQSESQSKKATSKKRKRVESPEPGSQRDANRGAALLPAPDVVDSPVPPTAPTRKNKKRRVEDGASRAPFARTEVMTTTTETTETQSLGAVILHATSPRAAASAGGTRPHPFAAFVPPVLHPHLAAAWGAGAGAGAGGTAAFVEHVVEALYAGFGDSVVDRAVQNARLQHGVTRGAVSGSRQGDVRAEQPAVAVEVREEDDSSSAAAVKLTKNPRKRRASEIEVEAGRPHRDGRPPTDAHAVAGPSGVGRDTVHAPAAAVSAAAPGPPRVESPPSRTSAPPVPPPAPRPRELASSPLKAPKVPPSSAALPAQSPASSASSSAAAAAAADNAEPARSQRRRSRVRPSRSTREAMARAAAEAHAEAVHSGESGTEATEEPATEASPALNEGVRTDEDETRVVQESVDSHPGPEIEPVADQQGDVAMQDGSATVLPAAEAEADADVAAAAASSLPTEDDELDQLESTPAGTPPPSAHKAQNRFIKRTRESDSFLNANGDLETPETSEDDEAEVQLSLQAHAAPASPGRKSPTRPLPLRELDPVDPEEAPMPPSAQTPAKTVAQEEEDDAQLQEAANTRLPSSSPEPDLPTIGGTRRRRGDDADSSDESSTSSDSSDDDDSSSGDEGVAAAGFLTGAARRLQSATGGRQSLGMVARDAFGKTRRPSLARKKPSGLSASGGGYNPSPLKNSATSAAALGPASSSSPVKGDPRSTDDVDEIDQLLSQTQQSQRAARRTSGVNWAQLEEEEEAERQRRKGRDRADSADSAGASSQNEDDDDDDNFEEAQEQLDEPESVQVVPADDDVDMAPADATVAEEAQATVNGAPAYAGEPVLGTAAPVAPRTTVDGDSAPITTALREVDADYVAPIDVAPAASQPLPVNGVAALEPALPTPTQEASQFPNGTRLYPDLSTIGSLASSSQPGSPPIEVDPSQVVSDDEPEQGGGSGEESLLGATAAESQFVPLHKDKPLFLETQTETQAETADQQDDAETDLQLDGHGEDEDVDMLVAEATEERDPIEAIQAPLTPDASAPSSPMVNAPAIVEPTGTPRVGEAGRDAAEVDANETARPDSPVQEQQRLLAPPQPAATPSSGSLTPTRMTRAASARIASRSPSAEPPSTRRNPTASVNGGTPVSALAKRKQNAAAAAAMMTPPLPTPSLADGLVPARAPAATAASLPAAATAARTRASGLPSLSQLDSVKRPTRRSARVSSATATGGGSRAASQPASSVGTAGSKSRFLARESDEDQDSSSSSEDEDAAAGAGRSGGKKQNGRLSMSQPVGGSAARPRRGRQSELWK